MTGTTASTPTAGRTATATGTILTRLWSTRLQRASSSMPAVGTRAGATGTLELTTASSSRCVRISTSQFYGCSTDHPEPASLTCLRWPWWRSMTFKCALPIAGRPLQRTRGPFSSPARASLRSASLARRCRCHPSLSRPLRTAVSPRGSLFTSSRGKPGANHYKGRKHQQFPGPTQHGSCGLPVVRDQATDDPLPAPLLLSRAHVPTCCPLFAYPVLATSYHHYSIGQLLYRRYPQPMPTAYCGTR